MNMPFDMNSCRGSQLGEPKGAIPLTMLEPGEEARVCDVCGGRGFVRRLFEMGITPGSKVTVKVRGVGRVIAQINNSRFALSRGLAQRIMVSK